MKLVQLSDMDTCSQTAGLSEQLPYILLLLCQAVCRDRSRVSWRVYQRWSLPSLEEEKIINHKKAIYTSLKKITLRLW